MLGNPNWNFDFQYIYVYAIFNTFMYTLFSIHLCVHYFRYIYVYTIFNTFMYTLFSIHLCVHYFQYIYVYTIFNTFMYKFHEKPIPTIESTHKIYAKLLIWMLIWGALDAINSNDELWIIITIIIYYIWYDWKQYVNK